MYDTSGLLGLGILASIILADLVLVVSKIIHPRTATATDVDSLQAIRPEQALPLIFFQDHSKLFQYPRGLTRVEIVDGRLASGTQFYTFLPEAQIFFCPRQNPEQNNYCLTPTKFEESEVLECQLMPKLLVYPSDPKMRTPCGQAEVGDWMVISYNICKSSYPYIYKTKRVNPYSFCYNKSTKKVLFVHYLTLMANLLLEELLVRERELKLDENLDTSTNGFLDPNYHTILEAQAESYPEYKFQYMLPPDYETLFAYRRAAYHYVNIALQHGNLINLWNEISDHIKTKAMETHQLPLIIITGVIDIPETELSFKKEGNQLYNIWITLIMSEDLENNYKGVVILMHNFIISNQIETYENQKSESSSSKQYIDKLCEKNLCIDSLKRKFQNVGGQLRCCKVTEIITGLFYTDKKDVKSIDEILEIRNVTYVENE